MQTLAILLPLLKYIVGGGAGLLASRLFDWLRVRYAKRETTGDILDRLLFSPHVLVTRLVILALSALFALPAAALAALIEGQDALRAVDAAAAALLAFTVSQLQHARAAAVRA